MTREQVESLPEGQVREVLDAWVKAKRTELPQALIESAHKPVAKLAKKALYQLQSSGVTVQAAPKTEAPKTVEAPKNVFESVLTMQLGSGERALFFAVPMRGGGLEIFQGIVHDELGLAQFASEQTNRARYRARLAQLRSEATERVMLVPFERMKLELGRALTLSERVKAEIPADVAEALQRLKIEPAEPDFPIPALAADDEAGVEDGAALHQLFEIEQWLPSEPDLVKLSGTAEVIQLLPGDPEGKKQKIEAAAIKLAHEVFDERVRALYARRLWYAAEVVAFQGREADVKRLQAEARRLMHSKAPSRFAEQLFLKSIGTLKKVGK